MPDFKFTIVWIALGWGIGFAITLTLVSAFHLDPLVSFILSFGLSWGGATAGRWYAYHRAGY